MISLTIVIYVYQLFKKNQNNKCKDFKNSYDSFFPFSGVSKKRSGIQGRYTVLIVSMGRSKNFQICLSTFETKA